MALDIEAQTKAVSDEWRRWIAENLLLGADSASLVEILVNDGVSLDDAHAEIEAARRHPYFHASQRLQNRLAKRDWTLAIPAKLNALAPQGVIQRRYQLSGQDFFYQFYRQNLPVIITGMLDYCPARTKWNLDYFKQNFGQREVEVQFARNADDNYEQNSIAHKRSMLFGDYVDLVGSGERTNDFYMTANNDSKNGSALSELWDDMSPLHEYLRTDPQQKGFLWFGPAGTITPLHHDLMNIFMSQIIGRKRVRMFAPWNVANCYNVRHSFSQVDGRHIDLELFPLMAGVEVLDCILEPGDILFLPVGWWHFVESLDISVTMSAINFHWNNDFMSNYPQDHNF